MSRSAGGRARIIILLLALAAALAAVPAPVAHASAGQESIFMDDNLVLYRGDQTSEAALGEMRALGATMIRVSVPWQFFAPHAHATHRPRGLDLTDPRSYDPSRFDATDHAVRYAQRLGLKVLLDVTGPAPLWAAGPIRGRRTDGRYRPSPRAFGDFVRMLGRRYDGTYRDENGTPFDVLPRVDHWSVWNEPNQGAFLQPQWARDRAGRWYPAAARIYRGLARAGTDALAASGHGQDTILLGETAPRGAARRGRTAPVAPVPFIAGVLCLDPVTHRALRGAAARDLGCDYRRRGALRLSGWAHHPYSIVSSPATRDRVPTDITLADRDRLGLLLDAGAALHRVPAHLPYWWTEYGWQTKPDPIRGVALADQARWIADAERITRADSRSAALTQFLLRDDPPLSIPHAPLNVRWRTYQTGLEFADGARKPAYDAYRLPLTRTPAAGGGVTLWGLVRPAVGATSVLLQFAPAGSSTFGNVGRVGTDASGVFHAQVTPPRSGTYRFTWQPAQPRSSRIGSPAPASPTYWSSTVDVTVG